MNKFQGDWSNYEGFAASFTHYDAQSDKGFPTEDEIILARCEEDEYEGSCCVYFRRDGKVFEEELSHCSCNSYNDLQNWAALVPITRAYMDGRDEGWRHTLPDAELWRQLKDACFPPVMSPIDLVVASLRELIETRRKKTKYSGGLYSSDGRYLRAFQALEAFEAEAKSKS